MKAVLFPGQGSQYVGMASDFYEKFDSVKKIFDKVDKTLGYSLSKLILKGPDEDLKLTQNTQPAIMTVGVSIFSVLNQNFNFNLKKAKFFAGHSLGEYTALVCAGSMTIERAAYLLSERGKAMQEAVPSGQGAMTAILGMTIDEVEKELKLLPTEEICEIANDNSIGQVVVSGTRRANYILNENFKKKRKRCIILPVSAPFHCTLMKKASEKMTDKIESTDFLKPDVNIISNVTANCENDVNKIKVLLIKQITARVRWRESVEFMIKNVINNFLEIGPGKILSGLVKKINKNVNVSNVSSLKDINK